MKKEPNENCGNVGKVEEYEGINEIQEETLFEKGIGMNEKMTRRDERDFCL